MKSGNTFIMRIMRALCNAAGDLPPKMTAGNGEQMRGAGNGQFLESFFFTATALALRLAVAKLLLRVPLEGGGRKERRRRERGKEQRGRGERKEGKGESEGVHTK